MRNLLTSRWGWPSILAFLCLGLLGITGGCGGEAVEEEGTVTEATEGDEEDTENEEPPTVGALDGSYFLCSGREGMRDTCPDTFLRRVQRSYFYFRLSEGNRLLVHDEDTTFVAELGSDGRMDYSGSFTAYYLSTSYSVVDNQLVERDPIACRVQVTDAEYNFIFQSIDEFQVEVEGTISNDSDEVDSCGGSFGIMNWRLPAPCLHQVTLSCLRTNGGPSEDEVLDEREEREALWEAEMNSDESSYSSPEAPSTPVSIPSEMALVIVPVNFDGLVDAPPAPSDRIVWLQSSGCSDFPTYCSSGRTSTTGVTVSGASYRDTMSILVEAPGTYYFRVYLDLDGDYVVDEDEPAAVLNDPSTGDPLAVEVSTEGASVTVDVDPLVLDYP